MKVIACFIRMHDMYTMCHGIQRITSSICTCSALRKHILRQFAFLNLTKPSVGRMTRRERPWQAEEKGEGPAERAAPLRAGWSLGRCPAITTQPCGSQSVSVATSYPRESNISPGSWGKLIELSVWIMHSKQTKCKALTHFIERYIT